MTRKLVLVPAQASAGDLTPFTYNLGIGAAAVIGSITIACLYEVRRAGTMFEVRANSDRPGTGKVYIDLLRSTDNGANWVSLLPAAADSKVVLDSAEPAGEYPRCKVTTFADSPANRLADGDLVGIAVLPGSSEDWNNIAVVGMWR